MWDLDYALAEEIGDPDLFVGRKQEMARLLKWAAGGTSHPPTAQQRLARDSSRTRRP